MTVDHSTVSITEQNGSTVRRMWMVVLAETIANLFVFSIAQVFGLIFKKICEDIDLSRSESVFVLISNISIGIGFAYATDYLSRKYGYRTVAFVGSFFTVAGLILSAFSVNVVQITTSFSIIFALGIRCLTTSLSAASEAHSVKTKRVAVYIIICAGLLGILLMPHLIAFLLDQFTPRDALLLIAAISGHSLIVSILLTKKKKPINNVVIVNSVNNDYSKNLDNRVAENGVEQSRLLTTKQENHETIRMNFIENQDMVAKEADQPKSKVNSDVAQLSKNPIFYSLVVGMVSTSVAEYIFGALMPFIMYAFGNSTQQVANIATILIGNFFVFRLFSEYLKFSLNPSPRIMCIFSTILLVIARICVGLFHDYDDLVKIVGFIGMGRGILATYADRIIPQDLGDQKVTAQKIINGLTGLTLLIAGPILGSLKNEEGTYGKTILGVNILNAFTSTLWTLELLLRAIYNFRNKVKTTSNIF